MGKGGQVATNAAAAPQEAAAEQPREYVLAKEQTWAEWFEGSRQPAGKWESPFGKWTEEDWKTRVFPTRSELKAVIPPHCFERSAMTGFGYVARDILVILVTGYVHKWCGLSSELPSAAWKLPFWVLGWTWYFLFQGGMATGLWVMGHEAGHYAFSPSPFLNDCVGWVIHSAFLVPYFSWQFSHGKHHRRTNHMMQGESHVPDVVGERHFFIMKPLYDFLGPKAYALFNIWYHLTLAFPVYFLGLLSGGRVDSKGDPIKKGECTDHYRPWSRLFPDNTTIKIKVLLSDLGLVITMGILAYVAKQTSVMAVLLWYGLPCFSTNHVYLVFATWLQHTHTSIPHFGESEWTWVKGAVAGTIDRPHPLFDYIAHHITSTHVCHHLFPEMPHYHALEATRALKAYLEPKGMYNCDPVDQIRVMWVVSQTCHYMDSAEGIVYYKSFDQVDKDGKPKEGEKAKAE